jgi:isopenicillin N synthase-like dioxygenase
MASKGRYKSTTHRVINASDSTSDRLSFPLFVHAHSKIELKPGFIAGNYLKERLAIIHKK